jgi:hypothetical protein
VKKNSGNNEGIPDSIMKQNDSIKTQVPQLEEYLSELMMVELLMIFDRKIVENTTTTITATTKKENDDLIIRTRV